MRAFELFEFQDYLTKDEFKKVEYIFTTQCVNNDFTEFKTSLGSNGKDYLSYLVAASLMDGTIENNPTGYTNFFHIANGFNERFFQNTIYHAYNLSVINDKQNIFNGLIMVAMHLSKKNKKDFTDFKEYQLKDYLESMIREINMSNQPNTIYLLADYQEHHKKLQSYLLKDELQHELPIHNTENKPINKI